MLDDVENEELVGRKHKFFTYLSDNFIDVAFMKNVVKDVPCYYHELQGNQTSGKCDDLCGNDHFFDMEKVDRFVEPEGLYILDIDLDFFATCDLVEYKVILPHQMMNYLGLMKKLGQNKRCIGITIALEPSCCGSESNCLTIVNNLSNVFEFDFDEITNDLLTLD